MKTFLLDSNNKPIINWGYLKDNVFFEGKLPEGHSLAICPTDEKQIILDIDNKNSKCGYDHIPNDIMDELNNSFNYFTKSGGKHVFLSYTGDKILLNKSTNIGLDLRIGKNTRTGNNGGYVKYNHDRDIRECIHLIKNTSKKLNIWLESLFS